MSSCTNGIDSCFNNHSDKDSFVAGNKPLSIYFRIKENAVLNVMICLEFEVKIRMDDQYNKRRAISKRANSDRS